MILAKKQKFQIILFILITVCLGALGIFWFFQNKETAKLPSITIGTAKLFIEVAETPALQALGLSGRQSLPANHGMLFDFKNQGAGTYSFWMKDMHFDLDIIWVNQNKVIGIAKARTPQLGESLINYYPPGPVDMVIEVNNGWAEEHHVSVGDVVKIPNVK